MKRNRWGAVAVGVAATLIAPLSAIRAEPSEVAIHVVSNRADLVSEGDALVEVKAAPDTLAELDIALNGEPVTDRFAVRGNGRYMGVLTGLRVGANDVVATTPTGSGARLTITNHSKSGPIFSGPHISPWICTTASNGLGQPDEKCNAPTKIEYLYQATGSTSFAPYDPANPPSNVKTITTDAGASVPYIIRQETGTQNRGIYRIAVLYDPAKPWAPWAPQEGWNRKLFYPFGASCGTVYSQGSAQSVQNNTALSRGFMVATSSLNVLGSNCNTVLSAETVMMLKERIVDNYGEIRYTFGAGGSGGSIGQNMVANSYPGLIQGITETLNYADTTTTGTEVFDCHLLFQYFTRKSPHLWPVAQQTLVSGHGTSAGTCAGWEVLFSATEDPTNGCGVAAEEHYNAETNPGGCRGKYEDYEVNVWGRRPEALWTPAEKAIGRGFANGLYDNIGVQYGLKALAAGQITTEQFVDLNEKVGGFDIDFKLTAHRTEQDPGTARTAYQAGRVNDAHMLNQVAIIDSRSTGNVDPLLIHTMHHTFAHKDRIKKMHGTAENHVSWRGGEPAPAFDVMDKWLSAVEADASSDPLPAKIIKNKPADARDMCFVRDQRFTNKATCDVLWPYYGAPRIVAGSPTTHDVMKCRLKPLDRDDAAYGPIPFTDMQWERLAAVFPDGVCDWSQPSVDIQKSVPWQTYADGPGTGRPLPPPPASQPL